MKTVFIAGATGYLGQFLISEYKRRGWYVRALVRDAAKAPHLEADDLCVAEATNLETLTGVMDGVNLVVSALGITRQRDGLSYRDVDYQANLNLLDEALLAGVPHFAYIHVLGADKIAGVPLIDAKRAFVDELQRAKIAETVIAPSGYFSDMGDFLGMAKNGRVWMFGDGQNRLNPIHGADLAEATADAVDERRTWLDVGGPEIFTHQQLAELAFSALNVEPRITRIPDIFRRITLRVLPWVTPAHISGPGRFFLSALGLDEVGTRQGTHHLADHFDDLARDMSRDTKNLTERSVK